MTTNGWLGCNLLEAIEGNMSGAVVFKGTRLPVQAIVENVDAFMVVVAETELGPPGFHFRSEADRSENFSRSVGDA